VNAICGLEQDVDKSWMEVGADDDLGDGRDQDRVFRGNVSPKIDHPTRENDRREGSVEPRVGLGAHDLEQADGGLVEKRLDRGGLYAGDREECVDVSAHECVTGRRGECPVGRGVRILDAVGFEQSRGQRARAAALGSEFESSSREVGKQFEFLSRAREDPEWFVKNGSQALQPVGLDVGRVRSDPRLDERDVDVSRGEKRRLSSEPVDETTSTSIPWSASSAR